jgi:Spy/CpxP family protein refolding chaperone
MASTKILMAAAVLLLTTAVAPAFAHDDYGDHADHWGYHRDLSEAHERAHEEGFYSRAEHRAYHRALRDLHEEFHEQRPGTWHDHNYGWRRYW